MLAGIAQVVGVVPAFAGETYRDSSGLRPRLADFRWSFRTCRRDENARIECEFY